MNFVQLIKNKHLLLIFINVLHLCPFRLPSIQTEKVMWSLFLLLQKNCPRMNLFGFRRLKRKKMMTVRGIFFVHLYRPLVRFILITFINIIISNFIMILIFNFIVVYILYKIFIIIIIIDIIIIMEIITTFKKKRKKRKRTKQNESNKKTNNKRSFNCYHPFRFSPRLPEYKRHRVRNHQNQLLRVRHEDPFILE